MAPNGRLVVVMTFALTGDRIAELGIVAEPARLRGLRLIELDPGQPLDRS